MIVLDKAIIFAQEVDEASLGQVTRLSESELSKNSSLRMMPDLHYGKGATVGTTIRPLNGKLEKVAPDSVGVDIGCLDRETEYLTKSGWKKINSFNGEEIMVYNVETDEMFFETPKRYVVENCEDFIHFKNSKGLDQMVCDSHRMLVFSGYKSKGYSSKMVLPSELLSFSLGKGYRSFKTSASLIGGGLDYTNDEIRLIAMISADATDRGSNRYELHFVKQRKVDRAKILLRTLKIDYRYTFSEQTKTHYLYFNTEKHYSKDLSEFYLANKKQLKVLYEESLLWDGHVNEKDSLFYSSLKRDADVIQFAMTANNIRAGLYHLNDKRDGSTQFQVRMTKNNMVGYSNTTERVRSEDGKKYCFVVSTGAFIARRKDKIFITGNCGIMTYKISKEHMSLDKLKKLDRIVHEYVPSGFNVKQYAYNKDIKMPTFTPVNPNDKERIYHSLGTLGGGNHFIDLALDENKEDYWLSVHSGSRKMGVLVASHHQNVANSNFGTKDSLNYLEGGELQEYLYDMKITQEYASMNRKAMLDVIVSQMGWTKQVTDGFDSIHNFISMEDQILRKGATSARDGERLIIPLNMAEGSLICTGKGNAMWNYSAPHGAGRKMSRGEAKREIDLEVYKESVRHVYSTTVNQNTLDEAPQAYKNPVDIMNAITDTVEINQKTKPVYVFKDATSTKKWGKK